MDKVPTEHEEAIILSNWLRAKGINFAKIPNETFTRSWSQKRKNKIEGVSSGVPDYMIVIPHKYIIFLELKRTKGGVISENQKQWISILNTIDNVEAVVCKGAQESINFLSQLI